MELNFIYPLHDWIIDRTNFVEIIWPALTTIIGIIASVLLATYIFSLEQEKEKQNRAENDKQILEIIINSLESEISNIKDLNKKLGHLEEITPNNVAGASKLIFDSTYLDSILNIDIISLNRVFNKIQSTNKDLSSVRFHTILYSIKNLYNHHTLEQTSFDSRIRDLFSEQDQTLINLFSAIHYPNQSINSMMREDLLKALMDYYLSSNKITEENKSRTNPQEYKTSFDCLVVVSSKVLEILDVENNNLLIATDVFNYAKLLFINTSVTQSVFNQFTINVKYTSSQLKEKIDILEAYVNVLKISLKAQ